MTAAMTQVPVPTAKGYLMSAGFETLGDVIKLSKKEVAKVDGIAPYLRELDALVWRSGLDYHESKA
jgi:hypothetical protein